MDVIIAARLSQIKRGKGQTSIESQDEDAREWAEEQGHNVIATIADHASGTKAVWQRKNLGPWVTQPDLMARYQGIVAAKQDRLSRAKWRDEGDLRRWAEDNGKTLFIVDRELRWPPRDGSHYDDDVTNWSRGAEEAHREWNNTSRRYKRMHKTLTANGYANTNVVYGYRTQGVNCGQTPCRCRERFIDDHSVPVIYEPEARAVREAVDRYLNREESITAICEAFNNNPEAYPPPRGGTWRFQTLARLLRKPSIAGRRENAEGKTTLRYPGIIDWQTHERLAARLDARASRKGTSPSNAYMLTGILHDQAGHPMHGSPASGYLYYRCRNGCKLMVRVEQADAEIDRMVTDIFGDYPHMTRQRIPGRNHFDEIARLRLDRNELDDMAADYETRHAEITAEIRRLAQLDKEHPEPDRIEWVFTGKSLGDHWASLSRAAKRDWLRDNQWTITATKLDTGHVQLTIDPTARDWRDVAATLGWPADEIGRTLIKPA